MIRRILVVLFLTFLVVPAQAQDTDVPLTERSYDSLADAQPGALTGAAGDQTTISYYGTTVRAAYVAQPASTIVRLEEAHQRFGGGGGIVAIIDTGVDPTHPALAGALVPGYDFTRNIPFVSELLDLDPLTIAGLTQSSIAFLDGRIFKLNQSSVAFLDQSSVGFLDGQLPSAFGHGTMVAGLVHLVAPSAQIMPLKAFAADGSSKSSDIVNAIYYAVDHGADVINMSFSIQTNLPDIAAALEYAAAQHVICVAAGGNMGRVVKLYPAGNHHVIGVGSTTLLDTRSAFSNYDVSSVTVSAPGEALVTLFPGGHYAGVWGTSFSAALISGSVALMRQAKPSASWDAIKDALDHGTKIEQKMGDARLDLLLSVRYLTQD